MYKLLSPLLLLALLVPALAGTRLKTTWRDPNVGKTNFAKIVVAYISGNADLRRRVEGGLARRIRRSVAANTVVPDTELKDREALRARLSSNGFDAAIVVRLVDFKQDKIASQGETWDVGVPALFWDGWTTGFSTVSTASYVYDEKIVIAEITLYSVATGKPVWSGRLKEDDAPNLRELLDNLVKAGAEELRKQKLI
jgi:hypothetical protein